MPRKKKDEADEAAENKAQEQTKSDGASSAEVAELRAQLAKLEKALEAKSAAAGSDDKRASKPEPAVEVECNSPEYRQPGASVRRWGYDFVVGESGTDLRGHVPESDVMNGVRAGRWKPLDMTREEAGEEFVRGQYRQILGKAPRRNASVPEMDAEIAAYRREQERAMGIGSIQGVREPAIRI